MSGRKQHYIPQFLLRSFGEAGAGKKVQVRVVGTDRTFIVPTDGVGARREFYSKLDEDRVTLDDEITEAENEYSAIFHNLACSPEGKISNALLAARLITHLCIRGNHLRGSTAAATAYASRRAVELFSEPLYLKRSLGIGQSEPNGFIREAFDKEYNERKAQMVKARVSRHHFRKIMFSELSRRWDELEGSAIESLASLAFSINAQQLSSQAHNSVLSRDLEPEKRVAALASLTWAIRDRDEATYVLPDSIALSHDTKNGVMPAMFVDNDSLTGVIFPLSPYRALCGGSYSDNTALTILDADFVSHAASASWEYVVAPPSFDVSKLDRGLIGQSVGKVILESIENAIQEDIAKTLGISLHS